MISISIFNKKHPSVLLCKQPELIENYEDAMSDTNETWQCHHRLETHFSDGTLRPKGCTLTAQELKALNMYFNRPPEELIFLRKSDHNALHFCLIKHKNSESKRKAISEANKGKTPWNKDKRVWNQEHRDAHSKLLKGRHWKVVNGKRVWYSEGDI